MNPRREFAAVVIAVIVGAALVLLAAAQVWVVETQPRPAPLPPVEVRRTGAALVPAAPALALVALAGAGALIATRGIARTVVGALLALAGAGAVVLLVGHLDAGWAVLGMLGGVLVLLAAAATLWRGRGWPTMGSRYGRGETLAPGTAPEGEGQPKAPANDVAIWDALDRGEDPTDGQSRT